MAVVKRANTILDARSKAAVVAFGVRLHAACRRTAELACFIDMASIASASLEELQRVEGVGPEIATSNSTFFSSKSGMLTWQALRDAGVNMTEPKRRASGEQPLAGKTVVVTGTLEKFSRSEIEKVIKERGGKVASSVSKKTDFLVCGEDAGSKLDRAKELGVKIVSEKEFLKLAGQV